MAKLTWLGHSGFLIESAGKKMVVDAWLEGPTYPGTDVSQVELVAVTHGHFDHAESAPAICNASGATLVCMHEVSFWAMQQGVPGDQVVGMNVGGTYEQDGWRLAMVPAVHSGGCPGDADTIVPGGAAAGFVITCPDGDVIYHAGDTAAFLDMRLIQEMHEPRIALLPIGDHYTMGPEGAAKAVELLGVKDVVPMHYGTFPLLKGTPAQLKQLVGGEIHVHVLEAGKETDLSSVVVA